MKVKTNHVPEGCDYLTNGKEYQVAQFDGVGGWVMDDDNEETYIKIEDCGHINGDWEIVEET